MINTSLTDEFMLILLKQASIWLTRFLNKRKYMIENNKKIPEYDNNNKIF